MVDQDLDELRRLLRHAFEGSRMYTRAIERALGVGHGNLERLLNGTLECGSATCSPSPAS